MEFARLSAALKQHDLGLILDFVPNHVGVHFDDNPWWLDVLEWGPASLRAVFFDIDWEQLPYRSRGLYFMNADEQSAHQRILHDRTKMGGLSCAPARCEPIILSNMKGTA